MFAVPKYLIRCHIKPSLPVVWTTLGGLQKSSWHRNISFLKTMILKPFQLPVQSVLMRKLTAQRWETSPLCTHTWPWWCCNGQVFQVLPGWFSWWAKLGHRVVQHHLGPLAMEGIARLEQALHHFAVFHRRKALLKRRRDWYPWPRATQRNFFPFSVSEPEMSYLSLNNSPRPFAVGDWVAHTKCFLL